MESKLYHIIFWLTFVCTPHSCDNPDLTPSPRRQCKNIKPLPRDVIRRIYAVLPYYEREGQNPAFLQRYRLTISQMSTKSNEVDREAAFLLAMLTPIVFLERYKDVKCLLERCQQALEDFQKLSLVDKRIALNILQRQRNNNHKIWEFVSNLPDNKPPTRTTSRVFEPQVEEEIKDRGDVRYLKELIKNLG